MFEVWFVGCELGKETIEKTFNTIEEAEDYVYSKVDEFVDETDFYIYDTSTG